MPPSTGVCKFTFVPNTYESDDANFLKEYVDPLKAVSYTHLDVYKRQIVGYPERQSFSSIKPGSSVKDVYKRQMYNIRL